MTYFDLGPYSRKITTSSPDAQLWFDRGLNWLFGFNHGEAIKCFQKALEHDGECAMAHWGISYASGPNYNLPWVRYDPRGRQMALSASYDAMQAALAHAGKASPVEQAMIKALTARYPQREAIEDMSPWDKAYTGEMRKIFAAFPDDLEVRAVFAESIMNETPWQMWDLPSGKPAEGAGTEECRAVLEYALDRIPAAWDHPGLLHLYVHLMEMSPFPQRALRAGDRLREIVPDSGHLIHMPTHLDVLCGHYNDVARLQPEGAGDRPQVPRLFGRSGCLPGLRHSQLPLRDLRRHVPRPVHARHRGGRGTDRHDPRGGAAHSNRRRWRISSRAT